MNTRLFHSLSSPVLEGRRQGPRLPTWNCGFGSSCVAVRSRTRLPWREGRLEIASLFWGSYSGDSPVGGGDGLGLGFSSFVAITERQSIAAQRLVKSGCVAIKARTSVIASISLSGESSRPHRASNSSSGAQSVRSAIGKCGRLRRAQDRRALQLSNELRSLPVGGCW